MKKEWGFYQVVFHKMLHFATIYLFNARLHVYLTTISFFDFTVAFCNYLIITTLEQRKKIFIYSLRDIKSSVIWRRYFLIAFYFFTYYIMNQLTYDQLYKLDNQKLKILWDEVFDKEYISYKESNWKMTAEINSLHNYLSTIKTVLSTKCYC